MTHNTCAFCSVDASGNHQRHCPSSTNKTQFKNFLDSLSFNDNIDLRPFDSLIEKYMGLMSAYMMTMDMIEVAGEMFGEQRLTVVGNYVLDKLNVCIDEIVELEERHGREKDPEE